VSIQFFSILSGHRSLFFQFESDGLFSLERLCCAEPRRCARCLIRAIIHQIGSRCSCALPPARVTVPIVTSPFSRASRFLWAFTAIVVTARRNSWRSLKWRGCRSCLQMRIQWIVASGGCGAFVANKCHGVLHYLKDEFTFSDIDSGGRRPVRRILSRPTQ
jgi:hypothetical protein